VHTPAMQVPIEQPCVHRSRASGIDTTASAAMTAASTVTACPLPSQRSTLGAAQKPWRQT